MGGVDFKTLVTPEDFTYGALGVRRKRLTPAHQLVFAIIMQAFIDTMGSDTMGTKRPAAPRPRDYANAREWIKSTSKGSGSFEWSCDTLGLPAEKLRNWALEEVPQWSFEDKQRARCNLLFLMDGGV